MPKQRCHYETSHTGVSKLILTSWGFFNVHLNTVLSFHPRRYAAAVGGTQTHVLGQSGLTTYLLSYHGGSIKNVEQ